MGGRADAVLPQRPGRDDQLRRHPGADYITNPKHQLKGVWDDPTPVPDDIVTLGPRRKPRRRPARDGGARASAHFQFDPDATYIIMTPPKTIGGVMMM